MSEENELRDRLERFCEDVRKLEAEIGRVLVGQNEVVRNTVIAMVAGGHVLLEGVPGLGKTLLVRTLSEAVEGKFSRIQFTPDLMPADLTGTNIMVDRAAGGGPDVTRRFEFQKGPVFANIVLADEINRATPKTQAALLEAMQEHSVTVGGVSHRLDGVFFVLATQNPLEMEGTYPLPEAQLDRFMLSIYIGYPNKDEERKIVMATSQTKKVEIEPVLQASDVIWIQNLVRQVAVSDHIVDYAVELVRSTRPKEKYSPQFVQNWLAWGAGPRAAQSIILTAKARAILNGRFAVSGDDIRAMCFPVLRHRIFANFNADAEGVDVNDVIKRIIEAVPEPSHGDPVAAKTKPTVAAPTAKPSGANAPAPPPPAPPGTAAPIVTPTKKEK